MSAQDLETFQAQLEQVEQALKADPGNEELTQLASELKELISLTEQTLTTSRTTQTSKRKDPSSSTNATTTTTTTAATSANGASTAGTSKSSTSHPHQQQRTWSVGDDCLAKYSGDDKWYPARITFIGGSEEKRVYSVVFRGYNSTELVAASGLRKLPPNYSGGNMGGSANGGGEELGASAGTKRKSSAKEDDAERERKKRRNEKKLEVRAAKAQEQDSKKHSWQKFATKSVKKGVGIAGVAGNSIFKTPDNPYGKVGVTGSGRGMTEVHQQKKHKFSADDEDE
ncbi:hypothetical protein FRC14_004606 [Serendipita sp. 396]|nr:hypothetical protein FRC14_004606 [Serendipita sp. 396]KAG8801152.1 hypothetical protein FRC16_001160 [Serendipita sp. 398]KAG8868984.1 hypothetical protein FRC20_002384 [Serendipita sp. 405]